LGVTKKKERGFFKTKFYERVVLSFWDVTMNIHGVIRKSLM